ncbi:MAG TPA: hypothetical protein VFV01_47970 [Spirillospora sp.]|nr:hypothetical protein [Spirillospora sp.]
MTATSDPAVDVIDDSARNRLPTGHVYVTLHDQTLTDHEIAVAAGLSSRHFGYAVTRHPSGTARVDLWND